VTAPRAPVPADHPGEAGREALLRFVERFAMALTGLGMPRMPARVFAYVLADDAERYTATELATGLRVSPAAISSAIRALVQAGLVGREREPGARVDTYRVYDTDLWGTITEQRERLIEPFEKLAAEGVELLGRDSPGGRRMAETAEFYAFMRRKLPETMAQWREQRETRSGAGPAVAAPSHAPGGGVG
jgi:DNA-binding transcriptional regulator GbsR (MarR family)